MNALCPSCTEGSGTVVDRRVIDDGGLAVAFECEECSEEWEVVF